MTPPPASSAVGGFLSDRPKGPEAGGGVKTLRALVLAAVIASPAFGAVQMPATSYLQGLSWLGHASFRWLRAGKTVYLDPWKLSSEPHDADLVLIGHPHFDHLNTADVAKVSGPTTEVVTVAECAAKLKEAGFSGTVRVVKPGQKLEAQGVSIEVVPAYNIDKNFHLKESGWAGFLVELDGVRLYHAGDTDFIPEMKELKTDVALLPVSGTYCMTAEQAAEAARAINPKVAVPMHYGDIVGTEADAKRFQKLCGGLIVEVLGKQ